MCRHTCDGAASHLHVLTGTGTERTFTVCVSWCTPERSQSFSATTSRSRSSRYYTEKKKKHYINSNGSSKREKIASLLAINERALPVMRVIARTHDAHMFLRSLKSCASCSWSDESPRRAQRRRLDPTDTRSSPAANVLLLSLPARHTQRCYVLIADV